MLSEIVFLIKAFWLIVIGFIKTVQSFLECAADVWNRFVIPSPRSAETTGAVYASAATMNQTEIVVFLLIASIFTLIAFAYAFYGPKPSTQHLTQYECPDKHEGVFTNQRAPKCKVCGKKMEKVGK